MNTDYFENDNNNKLQWLSIFLQCNLANLQEDEEIDENSLFIKANSAWFRKTQGTLTKHEFMPVLNLVISNRMVFNLSVSPLAKYKLASQQLKLATGDLVSEAIKTTNNVLNTPLFVKKSKEIKL